MTEFISDQTFTAENYTKVRLAKGEYENCIFKGCDFSNGYLDNQNFMECQFLDCNLSNANLANTIFKEVCFEHCKMMGLKFEECNDFFMNFDFHDCTLDLSSFYGLTLKGQKFQDCKLLQVDFTEADLTASNFDNCNLDKAIFAQTNLEKVDFRTAYNYTIDPEQNRLKKAQFSKEGVLGLLKKYGIVVR